MDYCGWMGHLGDGGLMLDAGPEPLSEPRNITEAAAQRFLEMYLKAGSELKKHLGQDNVGLEDVRLTEGLGVSLRPG